MWIKTTQSRHTSFTFSTSAFILPFIAMKQKSIQVQTLERLIQILGATYANVLTVISVIKEGHRPTGALT